MLNRTGPVWAGGGCCAPAADWRSSRLHIHPAAKELQIHVHLQESQQKDGKTADELRKRKTLCLTRAEEHFERVERSKIILIFPVYPSEKRVCGDSNNTNYYRSN